MKKITIYLPDGKKQIIKESGAIKIGYNSDPPMYVSIRDAKGNVLTDYIGFPFKVEKI